jgi:glycosyltransferase involved in cell wall biosynthesis
MSNEQENPLVSVVIPTYKRPDMLGRAINSVLNQTYDNIEIIVVDDNDADSEYRRETEEFLERYADVDNLLY